MTGAIGVIESLDNRQIGGLFYWSVQAIVDPVQGNLMGWNCRAKQFWFFELPVKNVAVVKLYWVEKCEMLLADTVKVRFPAPLQEIVLNKINNHELEMVKYERNE